MNGARDKIYPEKSSSDEKRSGSSLGGRDSDDSLKSYCPAAQHDIKRLRQELKEKELMLKYWKNTIEEKNHELAQLRESVTRLELIQRDTADVLQLEKEKQQEGVNMRIVLLEKLVDRLKARLIDYEEQDITLESQEKQIKELEQRLKECKIEKETTVQMCRKEIAETRSFLTREFNEKIRSMEKEQEEALIARLPGFSKRMVKDNAELRLAMVKQQYEIDLAIKKTKQTEEEAARLRIDTSNDDDLIKRQATELTTTRKRCVELQRKILTLEAEFKRKETDAIAYYQLQRTYAVLEDKLKRIESERDEFKRLYIDYQHKFSQQQQKYNLLNKSKQLLEKKHRILSSQQGDSSGTPISSGSIFGMSGSSAPVRVKKTGMASVYSSKRPIPHTTLGVPTQLRDITMQILAERRMHGDEGEDMDDRGFSGHRPRDIITTASSVLGSGGVGSTQSHQEWDRQFAEDKMMLFGSTVQGGRGISSKYSSVSGKTGSSTPMMPQAQGMFPMSAGNPKTALLKSREKTGERRKTGSILVGMKPRALSYLEQGENGPDQGIEGGRSGMGQRALSAKIRKNSEKGKRKRSKMMVLP
ncbi:hypothetical protein ADUPG1_008222 [Aduncisulcus paluster]|uniref:Uncharacterized protein n=1 Tax=Aduncisulcus paluster TaxID=2918883 RepID=A0ABQ5KR73_9EUKA|nr:hypothetical protein ADUPG1_008222 [Aduncisulcus paluster]